MRVLFAEILLSQAANILLLSQLTHNQNSCCECISIHAPKRQDLLAALLAAEQL
jgi:hypothetical protein